MLPNPVTPQPASFVLDESFAKHKVERMREMGATNVEPPLPRSAYLKNIKTGLVLPWSIDLAAMRDIMVNCDIHGNTDPGAWQSSVINEAYSPDEQALLREAAMRAIQGADKYSAAQPAAPKLNDPDALKLPHGAKPMQEFFSAENAEALRELNSALG